MRQPDPTHRGIQKRRERPAEPFIIAREYIIELVVVIISAPRLDESKAISFSCSFSITSLKSPDSADEGEDRIIF